MTDPGPEDQTTGQPGDRKARHLHVVPAQGEAEPKDPREGAGLVDWLKTMMKAKTDTDSLREAIEDYIQDASAEGGIAALSSAERALISNILKLRDMDVVDVMIPRIDIVAIDVTTSQADLLSLLSEKQFSRLPVYRENLDDILGTIHVKDVLSALARGKAVRVADLVRDVPIVAPSMPVLDLLLMMKQKRRHIALVVDEYGGIDGLATIGDVIEAIVGEIEDEYDQDDAQTGMILRPDGIYEAGGRLDIETLEQTVGEVLTEEEREDIDTLGGLVFALAGRIPARGEIIAHSSGIVFEVADVDQRRVRKVLIRNAPTAGRG